MKNTKLNTPEFAHLVNGFERELIKENKSESFSTENVCHIKEFLNYVEELGITSIKAIEQPIIDAYFQYLERERINRISGGTLSLSTIRKHQGAISNFLKFLYAENITMAAVRLKRRKLGYRNSTTVLSHEEIAQLYSVTDTSFFGYRDRCMLALLYGCGMRKSEALRLKITDIDFSKGWIHVRKAKNSRERYVMMSPKVQKQVEEFVYSIRDMYLSEDSNFEEVFISERGNPMHPESMAFRMDALCKRLKDRYNSTKWFGCHALRHSLGTHLYMAGMKVEFIALMLGHRTLESTQLYIHSAKQLQTIKTNQDEQI